MSKLIVKRGDIYYADLSPVVGSEQGGIRPVLVIQNDIGNKYSPTVIAAAITSQINKAKMPTHIELAAKDYGLNKDSVILLEQIRTIDKRRLRENSIMKQHFSKKNMQCYFIVSDHLIRFASENPIVRNTIDKYLFQMLNTAAWLSYKLPWEDRWFIANQYLRKYKRYISIRNLLILLFKRLITA